MHWLIPIIYLILTSLQEATLLFRRLTGDMLTKLPGGATEKRSRDTEITSLNQSSVARSPRKALPVLSWKEGGILSPLSVTTAVAMYGC